MEKEPEIHFTETPKWLCFKKALYIHEQANLTYGVTSDDSNYLYGRGL